MRAKGLKIIISGGGTGGHLFPALSIAEFLRKEGAEILFVGAKGRIEEKKVPEAGYSIELLNISGFARKLSLKNITVIFKLFKSLRKSKKIIKKFRPDIAVGVGGYASGPLLYAAAKRKIPCLIQEQNSYPGITNKILSKYASKICVAYEGLERFFPNEKIILTGNPIRETLVNNNITKKEAFEFFGLNPEKKTILSVGGSGGARSINNGVSAGLKNIIDADVQIIWQTGKYYFEDCKKSAQEYNSDSIYVTDFVNRMDMAYSAADIVISRAGAGTISELSVLKKASILVPSPNVAEDHQTKNAMALVKDNAAILVKDSNTENELIKKTIEVLNDNEKLKSLIEKIEKFAFHNSAEKIANEVLKILEKDT